MTDDELLLLCGVLVMLTWRADGIDWGTGWAWPVPDTAGARAVISQEYRWPSHHGVDIMLAKQPAGVVPVLAARAGTIWSVTAGPRGTAVVVDHGAPWATFYQHLTDAGVVKGQRVMAGERIGTMGADPTDREGIVHLHFEAWYKGTTDHAVDPAVMLSSARRVYWDGDVAARSA
jgi:murein DD-endopeptidase MepM/ murein hydrolase activator NlpD